jgi:hypothetical protein
MIALSLMLGLLCGSCGVRGRPQPPTQPPEIGDGVPQYYKKNKNKASEP